MRVGFIGLGNMGGPLAGFVLKAGFSLIVHDLRREAAATLLDWGAAWADSPKDVAAQCEVICICVPGPPEMQAVTLGESGVVAGPHQGHDAAGGARRRQIETLKRLIDDCAADPDRAIPSP
jgi:3-hydroxyisobutyrate dehydrogenase-like beta-hydroxyacid dehydrogenase